MCKLTFRNATEDDVSLILEFIRKLADYEKRIDEVIATEDELKNGYLIKTGRNNICT